MFIFAFSLKPDNIDNICICSLSGKPEIWVSNKLIKKDKDILLEYLRKKLNDYNITALITAQDPYTPENKTYIIIRHPYRTEYMELGLIPDESPDDLILFDDLFLVKKLMDEFYAHDNKILSLYNQLSSRLKSDFTILCKYLGLDRDYTDEFDTVDDYSLRRHGCCSRLFRTLSNNITSDKKIIIKLIKYGCKHKKNVSKDYIYSNLSEDMRHDIDIIKSMLSISYIQNYFSNPLYIHTVPHIFDFNFIIKNFNNKYVVSIYLCMDYRSYQDNSYKYVFNNMDICKRLVLFKMAIKYTIKLFIDCEQMNILYNIYTVTNWYIIHHYTLISELLDKKIFKEFIDILNSDVFGHTHKTHLYYNI
jgi:hypothetical protein